jgi:type I restriction enzyme, S subunit
MKAGWQTSTLGDTCELYQPKTISGKDMVTDGAYPVFGANGVIGRYDKFNHDESQLLITCRGATCGSVNISEPKSWITGNAMVVRPKNVSIEMRFLEYLFRGGIDISKAITGAAQPQITRTNLAPLEINYPVDVEEQQRIVGILDEAFDGIATAKANAEQNLQNARALFESHLQSVFLQRGEGWVGKPLSELCDIKHGFAFEGAEFSSDVPDGKPIVITPGNFTEDGKLLFSERNTKRFSGQPPAAFRFDIGDLVVVMTDLSSKMKIFR